MGISQLLTVPYALHASSVHGTIAGTSVEIASREDAGDDKGSNSIGLNAQDLFEIIPEAVSKPENEERELWSISYQKLVPVLIKAIQKQQEIIDKQQEQIKVLKEKQEYVQPVDKKIMDLTEENKSLNEKLNNILHLFSTAKRE